MIADTATNIVILLMIIAALADAVTTALKALRRLRAESKYWQTAPSLKHFAIQLLAVAFLATILLYN